MPSKKELTDRIARAARPFLEKGERIRGSAESMKGPPTFVASLLTPIGYFMLERPRHVVLTDRRLLVLVPPARGGGKTRAELALHRRDLRIRSFTLGTVWSRLVLDVPGGRPLGLNFARVWRREAADIHDRLAAR